MLLYKPLKTKEETRRNSQKSHRRREKHRRKEAEDEVREIKNMRKSLPTIVYFKAEGKWTRTKEIEMLHLEAKNHTLGEYQQRNRKFSLKITLRYFYLSNLEFRFCLRILRKKNATPILLFISSH